MSRVRSFLSALLAAALAGVMAACTGGGVPQSPSASRPAPSATSGAIPTTPGATDTGPIHIPLSGAAPDAIVLDGDTAWVLAGEGGTLMEVDLEGRREVRAIEVGFGATHVALPASGLAAVARFDASGNGTFLPIIDLRTAALDGIDTGPLGGLAPGEDGIVWALERADRLVKVDAVGRRVLGSVRVDVGENVHTEVQWGAGAAWVGSDGTPVVRVGGDLAVEASIAVDTGLPFLVRDGLVWGAGPEQLWAIDTASNLVVREIPLQDVIEVLAVDVQGDEAWLAIRHPGHVGAVLRLDLADGEVVEEHAVSLPAAVKMAPGRAWVASYLTNELFGFAR